MNYSNSASQEHRDCLILNSFRHHKAMRAAMEKVTQSENQQTPVTMNLLLTGATIGCATTILPLVVGFSSGKGLAQMAHLAPSVVYLEIALVVTIIALVAIFYARLAEKSIAVGAVSGFVLGVLIALG